MIVVETTRWPRVIIGAVPDPPDAARQANALDDDAYGPAATCGLRWSSREGIRVRGWRKKKS